MDKRIIFAVAGSGKTRLLIEHLNETDRFLVITYTNANADNLRNRIISKFGYFPNNIRVYTYFTFLSAFCYKPFLLQDCKSKGINYKSNPNRYIKSDKREFYIDGSHRLYSARIAKLIIETNNYNNVSERIAKYFDYLFIDEVQDFAGNDFNLLKHIAKSNVKHIYVGDYFQHTYDTSRDGNVNTNLHSDYSRYINEFTKMGLTPDTNTLSNSYRCSPSVCKFITEKVGIAISSHRVDETEISLITNEKEADRIFNDDTIVKLFYNESYNYDCFSRNWGESKGEDKYVDVCVVLNKVTMARYYANELSQLTPSTRNKLYVALTRTRSRLYLIPHHLMKKKTPKRQGLS